MEAKSEAKAIPAQVQQYKWCYICTRKFLPYKERLFCRSCGETYGMVQTKAKALQAATEALAKDHG